MRGRDGIPTTHIKDRQGCKCIEGWIQVRSPEFTLVNLGEVMSFQFSEVPCLQARR